MEIFLFIFFPHSQILFLSSKLSCLVGLFLFFCPVIPFCTLYISPTHCTESSSFYLTVVAHGLSCSMGCGLFPDQESNPPSLHWQADSLSLSHQGSQNLQNFFNYLWIIKTQKLSYQKNWFLSSLEKLEIWQHHMCHTGEKLARAKCQLLLVGEICISWVTTVLSHPVLLHYITFLMSETLRVFNPYVPLFWFWNYAVTFRLWFYFP